MKKKLWSVEVLSRGKYGNVELGKRYCLSVKSLVNLINNFSEMECRFTVQSYINIHSDVFVENKNQEEEE